jgi:hypothetical protein
MRMAARPLMVADPTTSVLLLLGGELPLNAIFSRRIGPVKSL